MSTAPFEQVVLDVDDLQERLDKAAEELGGEAPEDEEEEDDTATLLSVGVLLAILGVWELAAQQDWLSDNILVGPTEILDAFSRLVTRAYFWDNLWATLWVIFAGFVLASISAIVLAVGMSLSAWIRRGVYPVVVLGNVVPKVALIPLIIVTVGFGANARIIVVIMSAFFPVFLNTLAAMIDADVEGEKLLTSLGANRFQHLRLHKLPAGLPSIFAGLKVSLTVAFIAGVLSELLIRREGLGYLITVFRATLSVDMVFAVTVTVGLIGMAIFFGMEWLERHVVFWKNSQQNDSTPL